MNEQACCDDCKNTNQWGDIQGCHHSCHSPQPPKSLEGDDLRKRIVSILETPMRSRYSTADIRIGHMSSTAFSEKISGLMNLLTSERDENYREMNKQMAEQYEAGRKYERQRVVAEIKRMEKEHPGSCEVWNDIDTHCTCDMSPITYNKALSDILALLKDI